MSKGFFNSLSNLVSDGVYTVTRAAFAVGTLGTSEVMLAMTQHESPMERRERLELQKRKLELQKEIIIAQTKEITRK